MNVLVAIQFGGFIVLLLIGTPVAISLGVSALAAMWYLGDNPIKMVQIAWSSVGSFPLMALPSFILAGALMQSAGLSRRLIKVAQSMTGRVTGGLGAATVLACLFFGAISGSGPATPAAVGMLMIPAMTKNGYARDYAGALTAAGGGLGIIVPPSIPMVVFGISAMGLQPPPEAVEAFGAFDRVTITRMFLAGVVPGMVLALVLLSANFLISHVNGYGPVDRTAEPAFDLKEIMRSVIEGFWALLAPLVILGGIYSGYFTPTEAAVIAIFYTLFIGIFVYRELTLSAIVDGLQITAWLSGRILLILFTATLFGRVLVENDVPGHIAAALLATTDTQIVIWLVLIALLLVVGMFMETLAAIMILVPVLLPIAYHVGIDPTHFGVVMIATLAVGFQTPPLGENLFIASGVTGEPLERLSLRALPFVIAMTIAVLVIALFPQLSLWLPVTAL